MDGLASRSYRTARARAIPKREKKQHIKLLPPATRACSAAQTVHRVEFGVLAIWRVDEVLLRLARNRLVQQIANVLVGRTGAEGRAKVDLAITHQAAAQHAVAREAHAIAAGAELIRNW